MRIILFLSILTLLVSAFSSCKTDQQESTIYLVRHAEKIKTDTTDNPALTPEGAARAQRLVQEFSETQLKGIFSTSYIRNMETVRPLADAQGLSIGSYEPHGFQPLLDSLRQQAGAAFLICGHSNTLMPMIEYLGGEKPAESLEENEYDKIFRIGLSGEGAAKVEISTY